MSRPVEIAVLALRIALFRRVRADRIPAGVGGFVASTVLSCALVALAQWLGERGPAAISTQIAPGWLASLFAFAGVTIVIALAFAWVLRVPLIVLATGVTLAGLVVQCVWLMLLVWPGPASVWLLHWAPWLTLNAWWVGIWVHVGRSLRASTHAFTMPRVVRGQLLTCAGLALLVLLYTSTLRWDFVSVVHRAEPSGPSFADENHFHNHRGVLAETLAELLPSRPGRPDLYFVGFAPDATDAVFPRETRSIRRLMDQRFGTMGRSIALINHQDALSQEPMASATQLQETLDHIASIMDVQEDVLFMYVTTHGERNGDWVVSAPPLKLNGMNARELKRMLDEAGIRWRVLVISACYSGTSLAAFADPYTLVMTASDADNPSFGCGNQYDFTYWGDALFNHGLAQTDSLPEAYDLAAKYVRARELKDGFTPSNPQMQQGEAIGLKLRELALQWKLDRAERATQP